VLFWFGKLDGSQPQPTVLKTVIITVSLMRSHPSWFTVIVSNVMPVWQLNLFSVLAPEKISAKVQTAPSAVTKNSISFQLSLNQQDSSKSRGFEAILTPTSWEEKRGARQ